MNDVTKKSNKGNDEIENEQIERSEEWIKLEDDKNLQELIKFRENSKAFIEYAFEFNESEKMCSFNESKIKELEDGSIEHYKVVNFDKMIFYLSKLVFKNRPGDNKDSWKYVLDYYGDSVTVGDENDSYKQKLKKLKNEEIGSYKKDENTIYSVRFDDLMDALKDLSEIYNSIALQSVKWFNERIEEALKNEDYKFKTKASAYCNGPLESYFWYKIKFYSEANPISLSVFANSNQNKKIVVAIELHDSKAEKNRIPSYFIEKINSIISILDQPKKYRLNDEDLENYKELKYMVNEDKDDEYTGNKSVKNVPKNRKDEEGRYFYNSLENKLNNEKNRIRVFFEINNNHNDDKDLSNEILERIKMLSPLAKIVSKTTYIEQEIYKTIYSRNVNQMILTGAPGTGKTYGAKMYVKSMVEENEKRMSFVQFHPSYDYTDFVEGIRPIKIDDKTSYVKMDGTFKSFCRKIVDGSLEKLRPDNLKKLLPPEYMPDDSSSSGAENDGSTEDESVVDLPSYEKVISCPDDSEVKNEAEKAAAEKRRIFDFIKKIACKKEKDRSDFELELLKIFDSTNEYEELYYFIIDEVNRADISKVLGELMYGLEYRGLENRFPTQYQQLEEVYKKEKDEYKPLLFDCFLDGFFIPKNLVIIGTMNDIDKSVESFDFALRRRFHWITVDVDKDTIRDVLKGISDKNGYDKENELEKLVNAIYQMNDILVNKEGTRFGLSSEYKIGPTYFSSLINGNAVKIGDVEGVFDLKVSPTLKEYVRGSKKEALVEDFIGKCKTALTNGFSDSSDSENQKGSIK